MRIISVGSSVMYTLWGESGSHEATVEGIEIVREGEKSGRPVSHCNLDKHKGRGVVCDMSDGHWCYGEQIKRVLPKKSKKDE